MFAEGRRRPSLKWELVRAVAYSTLGFDLDAHSVGAPGTSGVAPARPRGPSISYSISPHRQLPFTLVAHLGRSEHAHLGGAGQRVRICGVCESIAEAVTER